MQNEKSRPRNRFIDIPPNLGRPVHGVLRNQGPRIDIGAADEGGKMEVGSGGKAGGSDFSNDIPFFHHVSRLDEPGIHVIIHGF